MEIKSKIATKKKIGEIGGTLPQWQVKLKRRHNVGVMGEDTECPLQVCQLSRPSESTHFPSLRRDVALLDSTRAPDDF